LNEYGKHRSGAHRRFVAGGAATIAATALIGVPANASLAAAPAVEDQITALAATFLQADVKPLVTESATSGALAAPRTAAAASDVQMSAAMAAKAAAKRAKLAVERARLAAANVTYSKVESAIESRKVTVAGDVATIELRDITALTPSAAGEPVTEQALDRVLQFRKVGAAWQLQSEALVGIEGISPISAPGLDVNAVRVDNSGPIGTDPVDTGTDGPLDDVEKNEDTTWQDPKLTESAVTGSAPANDKPAEGAPAATRQGAGVNARAIPKGMCYSCMVDYTNAHWKNYHKGYRSFVGKGGDCTNFISQIMRRGGWKDDKGWYRSNGNWWYTNAHQTWTWAGAENWSKFAPKRTQSLNNVWKLGIADVLQIDFNRDGVMDHSMVVNKVTSKDVYLTYHSPSTKNRSLRAILKSNPRAYYFAYRT
jgi:hypothetical protein